MKLISFGIIDKKFMLYLFLNTIIVILINCIDLFFADLPNGELLQSASLNGLINFSFLVLFGIPELILRKKYLNIQKKENKEEGNAKNVNNKIVYLYKKPIKSINCKAFLLLLFLIIVIIYLILLIVFFIFGLT